MKAVYVRVSTEEQATKGYSLKDQLHECKKRAGTGAIIKEYIDDGISGEFLDRPALEQLRVELRNGLIDEVICLDPDRLSRKLVNQLILTDEIEKKAKLTFINHEYEKTPEGRLFYQMKGAVSEYEKAKINERMSRGRRQKAREGKIVRDYNIYGYKYDKSINNLIPDPYESVIVKQIFECFTGKMGNFKGLNGVAKYLNDQKIPTKLGKGVWHRQVVRQIISNPVYIGVFLQNKWNCEGMLGNKYRSEDEKISMKKRPEEEWIPVSCPPIIDEDTFQYAQELFKQLRRRYAGNPRYQYLLSGLIRCGKCNNTMTGVRAKNWGKYVFEYTDRKNYAGANNPGCGKRVKVETVDNLVWQTVLNWLNNQEKIDNEKEDKQDRFEEFELIRIKKRLNELTKERNNLIGFLSKAQLDDRTISELNKKLNNINDEQNSIEKRKTEIEGITLIEIEIRNNLLKEATEYYFRKGIDEITFNDKRELIRLLVKEVIIFDNEIKVYGF